MQELHSMLFRLDIEVHNFHILLEDTRQGTIHRFGVKSWMRILWNGSNEMEAYLGKTVITLDRLCYQRVVVKTLLIYLKTLKVLVQISNHYLIEKV